MCECDLHVLCKVLYWHVASNSFSGHDRDAKEAEVCVPAQENCFFPTEVLNFGEFSYIMEHSLS